MAKVVADRAVTARLEYTPELDGLRAITVLAVIAYHVPESRTLVRSGFIGVDVFFALSGALITRLLLVELDQSGRIALGRFYIRRLRRLYPGLLAMLTFVVVSAVVLYDSATVMRVLKNAVIAGLYLASFVQPYQPMPNLGHMWSLSIEEVFYLVWPVALWLLFRSSTRAILGFLLVVVLAVFGWRVHLYLEDFATASRIYFALDTRIDALAFGCIAGVLVHTGWAKRRKIALVFAAPIAALALAVLAVTADRAAVWYATWGYSLTGTLAAVLIARLFVAEAPALRVWPLIWIGKRSYGFYLWHLPLIAMSPAMGLPAIGGLAIGIALACLSYSFIESPLRAH